MTRQPSDSAGNLSTEWGDGDGDDASTYTPGIDLSDTSEIEQYLGFPLDVRDNRSSSHVDNNPLRDKSQMIQLLSHIAAGLSYSAACGLTGVDLRTFYRWRKRGKDKDSPKEYRLFAAALSRAEGEAELRAVNAWTSSFERDWKAAQAYLARRFPERWGTAEQQVSVEENEDRGLKVIISKRESKRPKDQEEIEIDEEVTLISNSETIVETNGIVVNSEEEQEIS